MNKYLAPLGAVIGLVLIAWVLLLIPGMQYVFGIFIPYVAMGIFLYYFCMRVIGWAKAPVPFKIPTTCGQANSLDFIKQDKLEAPSNNSQVVARMALEILLFRSLWRNTKSEVHDGPKLTYESSRWLWLAGIVFHYCFLTIVIRHMRFFMDPAPFFVTITEYFDSIMQIGAPALFMSGPLMLGAVAFLFGRRLVNAKVRYISLANDYFPLYLIFAIGLTGILMRYYLRTDIDIIAIKRLAVGLVTFKPSIGANIGAIFYIHFFLVCTLLVYFPFSKLMHLGGVFMSPTRNMANDTRMKRHINPWNDPSIKPHSYAGYEDEFREFMVNADIPVEKDLPEETDK